jgi:predicted molibdopterin-dependent oxidoreductase YjgC
MLMSAEDAASLELREGARVLLRSATGQLEARCRIVPIKPRNVQVYWPEANALMRWGVTDPVCGIPDYHTLVQIEPLDGPSANGGA